MSSGQRVKLMRTTDDWAVDDLDRLPDDGLRYELVDGVLLVGPAPRPRHQRAVLGLARLLADACPPDLEVFVAPLDFRPTRHYVEVAAVRGEQVHRASHPFAVAVSPAALVR